MLNVLEFWKEYQSEISKSFEALENLSDGEKINRAWENIEKDTENLAIESQCLHELKQHRQCFDEERLGFSYQKTRLK